MAVNNTSMKKVWSTRLTDYSATDKEGIGAIRFEGAKVYKYIKYNSGSGPVAAVAGNMAYYHGDDSYTADEADVTSDLSDSANIAAGMLMSAIPNGYYGWVQIKGVATLNTALTAGADGNALTAVGATDGTLDVSAAATDAICAIALDASAKIVLLDCPW
jgi:hypothetical protein